jgi:hypothetical protein
MFCFQEKKLPLRAWPVDRRRWHLALAVRGESPPATCTQHSRRGRFRLPVVRPTSRIHLPYPEAEEIARLVQPLAIARMRLHALPTCGVKPRFQKKEERRKSNIEDREEATATSKDEKYRGS